MSDRNPWAVLGLAVGTTDAAEVRRAYAARLRESPPEADPDAFRRVRDAYEKLRDGDPGWLRYLAAEARGEDPDVADDDDYDDGDAASEAQEASSPEPLDDGVAASWAALLRDALKRTDLGRGMAVQAAVASAARQAAGPPPRLRELAAVLRSEEFRPHEAELAASLPPAAVLASLQADDGALAGWAADTLSLAGNLKQLARVADAAAEMVELHDPSALDGMLGLARAAAIVTPKSARHLADIAWKLAPPGARARLRVEPVDLAASAARDVADWPPADRALLARIVYAEGTEGEVAPGRFQHRLSRSRRSADARRLVATLAPELMPEMTEKKRKEWLAPQNTTSSGWRQAFVILLVVVGVISKVSMCEGRKIKTPSFAEKRGESRRTAERRERTNPSMPPADRRELDAFHQQIVERSALTAAERSRFERLTERNLRSVEPLARTRETPLTTFEKNELAAYRVRLESSDFLTMDEQMRMGALLVREKVPGPAPPGSSGGR